MNFKNCSIGLHTRVKDKRNFIANYSHHLDEVDNEIYTEIDDKKKCEIFGISKNNIDFITKQKMTGIGDHYYPLCKDFKSKQIIGSDSAWNRIPVSGNNQKYKNNPKNIDKVNEWISFCSTRGAKLYHCVDDKHINFINDAFEALAKKNQEIFDGLIQLK